MSDDNSWVVASFSLFSILLFALAAMFRWGRPRAWFLPSSRWSRPRYWYYGIIFEGMACLSPAVAVLWDMPSMIWCFGGFTLLYLACAALRPRWVEPKWMSWLRDRYDWTTLEFMFDQARQNPSAWTAQVSTQEGLERWAREMECLLWLKGRYGSDEVAFMLAEARLDDGWTERVSTEAGLIAWAEEMEVRFRERRRARRP